MRQLIVTRGRALALPLLMAAQAAAASSGAPLRCASQAAGHYKVDVLLVRAIMRSERTCGAVHRNANGTNDYGCMGINTIHLPELAQYGITARKLVEDDCLNIYVGTWIFKRELVREPNLWKAIGNYNSHTPRWNRRYQALVWKNLQALRRSEPLTAAD